MKLITKYEKQLKSSELSLSQINAFIAALTGTKKVSLDEYDREELLERIDYKNDVEYEIDYSLQQRGIEWLNSIAFKQDGTPKKDKMYGSKLADNIRDIIINATKATFVGVLNTKESDYRPTYVKVFRVYYGDTYFDYYHRSWQSGELFEISRFFNPCLLSNSNLEIENYTLILENCYYGGMILGLYRKNSASITATKIQNGSVAQITDDQHPLSNFFSSTPIILAGYEDVDWTCDIEAGFQRWRGWKSRHYIEACLHQLGFNPEKLCSVMNFLERNSITVLPYAA